MDKVGFDFDGSWKTSFPASIIVRIFDTFSPTKKRRAQNVAWNDGDVICDLATQVCNAFSLLLWPINWGDDFINLLQVF